MHSSAVIIGISPTNLLFGLQRVPRLRLTHCFTLHFHQKRKICSVCQIIEHIFHPVNQYNFPQHILGLSLPGTGLSSGVPSSHRPARLAPLLSGGLDDLCIEQRGDGMASHLRIHLAALSELSRKNHVWPLFLPPQGQAIHSGLRSLITGRAGCRSPSSTHGAFRKKNTSAPLNQLNGCAILYRCMQKNDYFFLPPFFLPLMNSLNAGLALKTGSFEAGI